MSFSNDGKLLLASDLPSEVAEKIRLDLTPGRVCGAFNAKHQPYLEHHRDMTFQKAYLTRRGTSDDLHRLIVPA